jgi:hypothetical protein
MPKSQADRKLKAFTALPREERKTPDSLRLLLHDLICERFERNPYVASERLREILKKDKEPVEFRVSPKALWDSSFLSVLQGRQQISYSQMDAMARAFDIPMGLMLLFSRARSDVRKTKHAGEALRVLRAASAAIALLENMLGERDNGPLEGDDALLTHALFEQFCKAFDDKYHELLI